MKFLAHRQFFLFNICPFLFSTKSLIFKKYTTKRKKLIEAYKIKYLPTYGRKLKITQFYEFGYITNFLRNDIKQYIALEIIPTFWVESSRFLEN